MSYIACLEYCIVELMAIDFSELASLVSVCFYDVLDQSDPGLKLELSYRLNYVQVRLHTFFFVYYC